MFDGTGAKASNERLEQIRKQLETVLEIINALSEEFISDADE